MNGLEIIHLKASTFHAIPESDLKPNGIYFLDNGQMYVFGKLMGADTEVVNSFPVSPTPNVVYVNRNTFEQRMWANGQWNSLTQEYVPITNTEIDELFANL